MPQTPAPPTKSSSVFGLVCALILVHGLASMAVGEIARHPSDVEWAIDAFMAVSVAAVGVWVYLGNRPLHILGGYADHLLGVFVLIMVVFVGVSPLVDPGVLRLIMLVITGVAITALLVGPAVPRR